MAHDESSAARDWLKRRSPSSARGLSVRHIGIGQRSRSELHRMHQPESDGERHTGKLRNYDPERGFGFIDYPGDSIFVHISDVFGVQIIYDGDELEFEIGAGRGGKPKAVNVTVKS